MIFGRFSLLVILGGFALSVAQAEPFSFYRVDDGGYLSLEFSKTPFDACMASLHGFKNSTNSAVVAVRYNPNNTDCNVLYADGTKAAGIATNIASSCPGDIAFSFEHQECVDHVNEEQRYALSLAAYLWLCLIGGMLVGFRLAQ